MTTTNWTAKLGGSFVNVQAGGLSIETAVGQRGQGTLQVYSALGVNWQYGTQVQIYDDTSALVFAGYVLKDTATRAAGTRQGDLGVLEHQVDFTDNCYRADKRLVFKTYANVTCGAIIADLVNAYLAAEGVTYTSSTVATGPTIVSAIWSGSKSVADALSWMAEQAGYWWTIDKSGVLYFQPYGAVAAPFTMDGTSADSVQGLTVEYGNDLFLDKQFVKGSYGETSTLIENFVGDGVSRSFTLSYPLGTLLSLSVNGSDLTAYTLDKGETGGRYYVADGDPVVAQDTGQTILTSSDALSVQYRGRFPVLVAAQNTALIATQQAREGVGTGIVESVYTNTKVRTLTSAFQIAQALLSHYGVDTTSLEFTTKTSGLAPGQMLPVNLPDFGLNGVNMLITGVSLSDQLDQMNIWYTVECIAGPAEVAQWQTFWQDLMAQSSDPGDFTDAADTALALVNSVSFSGSHSFTVTNSAYVCPLFSDSTVFADTTFFC